MGFPVETVKIDAGLYDDAVAERSDQAVSAFLV